MITNWLEADKHCRMFTNRLRNHPLRRKFWDGGEAFSMKLVQRLLREEKNWGHLMRNEDSRKLAYKRARIQGLIKGPNFIGQSKRPRKR